MHSYDGIFLSWKNVGRPVPPLVQCIFVETEEKKGIPKKGITAKLSSRVFMNLYFSSSVWLQTVHWLCEGAVMTFSTLSHLLARSKRIDKTPCCWTVARFVTFLLRGCCSVLVKEYCYSKPRLLCLLILCCFIMSLILLHMFCSASQGSFLINKAKTKTKKHTV